MQNKKTGVQCRLVRRHGRSGWLLGNDQVAFCWLAGGGHLASFCRCSGPASNMNLLWEATWRTIDPQRYSTRKHGRKYGAPPAGKFLSGFTGHALCVDYFGAPSAEETRAGLPLHGEVASSRWTLVEKSARRGLARLSLRGAAPSAGFSVQRDVTLRENECVGYVTETITNKRNCDRYFQWVQHATFGPPFLQTGESVCLMPGTRSKTWPLGYDGKNALMDDREFSWPEAPACGGGVLDISRPFAIPERGFVAGTLLADQRNGPFAYVAVLNWRLGLLAGYFFRRSDFPWIAVWEENRARTEVPWDGKTQARGLEFGTSPLPLGLRDAIMTGPVFGTPTVRCVPARSQQKASYAIFVTEVPRTWRTIAGMTNRGNALVVAGPNPAEQVTLAAGGFDGIWPDQPGNQERASTEAAPQGDSPS